MAVPSARSEHAAAGTAARPRGRASPPVITASGWRVDDMGAGRGHERSSRKSQGRAQTLRGRTSVLDFRTLAGRWRGDKGQVFGPTRRDLNGCCQRWMRYPPQLCAGHEVEVVPPDGALQRGEDGCGVVVGALD